MSAATVERDAVRSVLARAQELQALVRVSRARLEPEAASTGYVLATTADLVLIQKLSDRIDLDGYEILRIRDIDRADTEFKHREFYLRALELKGEEVKYPRGVQTETLTRVIETAAERYGVVVISRERKFPDEVAIGRLRATLKTGIRIDWVTPSAELEEDDTLYRYADITRLEFGGTYEQTLALVAGLGPGPARSAIPVVDTPR